MLRLGEAERGARLEQSEWRQEARAGWEETRARTAPASSEHVEASAFPLHRREARGLKRRSRPESHSLRLSERIPVQVFPTVPALQGSRAAGQGAG